MGIARNRRILNRFFWLFCSLLVASIAIALAPQDVKAGWDRDGDGDKYSMEYKNENEVHKWINCKYSTINSAFNAAKKVVEAGQRIRITVTRSCHENVTIDIDGVTLEGGSRYKGTINGNVTIDGAQRVVIRNLTIQNSDWDGVTVLNGAHVSIEDNVIRDNAVYGVQVYMSASANVIGNEIENNGTFDNFGCGVGLFWQSMIFSQNNLIKDNGWCGVDAGQNSYYLNSYINDPPEIADVIEQTAANTLALECYRANLCEVRNSEVYGNIAAYERSVLRVRSNSSITGTVEYYSDSYVQIDNGVTGGGTLVCGDSYVNTFNAYNCGDTFNGP